MELIAVKLSPLNTGGNYRIRCRGRRGLLRPLRYKIEGHAGYEKRNRKMDRDNKLRMLLPGSPTYGQMDSRFLRNAQLPTLIVCFLQPAKGGLGFAVGFQLRANG